MQQVGLLDVDRCTGMRQCPWHVAAGNSPALIQFRIVRVVTR
jgi:hypothetical protein